MAQDNPNKRSYEMKAGKKKTASTTAATPPAKDPITGKASGGPGWKWPLALATLVAVAAGSSVYLKILNNGKSDQQAATEITQAAAKFPDTTGPEAGYAGGASCAECHAGIAESYGHIAMGRSLYPPTTDNIIEDYDANNEFHHEASNQYFRMTHEGEKFFQTRFQKAPDGSVINEKKVDITYVVGSGNHSRSYVHREPDGKLYQLPVAWYTQEKQWAMNPGYDNAQHISFSRRITYDCMFCHAAYPDLPAGADQFNYGETAWFPEKLEAIDCERCHGPAAAHVKLAKGGAAEAAIREAIVNPANLSNELQLETCMQCHLETTSGKLPHSVHALDKGIFGYRPGEPLEEYRYAFDHPKGTGHDDKFEIAGQAYRMRMSPCFIKSEGKMTCTTCHDPHRVPTDRIDAGIQSCLECHKPADCTEKIELRLPVQDNCIQCHMPERRTDDAVHVTMTDHFIQRRPPPPETLLAPKKEHSADYKGDVVPYYPKEIDPAVRDLYLGLAHIGNSADLTKGIDHLDKYLNQQPDQFAPVYTRGVAFKMLGQMDRARADIEQAVKLLPQNPQARMALGDLYEIMGNYTESLKCYKKAIELGPRLSRAHNGAGTSLLLAGDIAGAEPYFRAAVVQDPFDENAHLNLAGIFVRRGELVPAEAEAKAALAINPAAAAGWMHLAQCALATGRADEAIWTSLESLKLDPNNVESFDLLISACKSAGSDTALVSLAKAGNRALFSSQIAKALVQIETNDQFAAGASLTEAAKQTTAPVAMSTAVKTALNANRFELALLWSGQAYQAEPGNEEALINYVSALRASGHAAAAKAELEKSLSRQPSARLLNAMAWLLSTTEDAALRNGRQAEQQANEAAAMLGQANVFVMQSQAAAAAETGEYDKAVAISGQALKMAQDAKLILEIRRIEAQQADYKTGKPHRAKW